MLSALERSEPTPLVVVGDVDVPRVVTQLKATIVVAHEGRGGSKGHHSECIVDDCGIPDP